MDDRDALTLKLAQQPAQAAASPEGEGREASEWPSGRPVPAEDCYIAWCRWDGRSYVICDSDAPKAFKVYRWAALRQSAAPSGGDLYTPSKLSSSIAIAAGDLLQECKKIIDHFCLYNPIWHDFDGKRQDPLGAHALLQKLRHRGAEFLIAIEALKSNHAVAMTDEAPQQLQGESKTGAVTDARSQSEVGLGHGGAPSDGAGSSPAASIPESGETGAVTETK